MWMCSSLTSCQWESRFRLVSCPDPTLCEGKGSGAPRVPRAQYEYNYAVSNFDSCSYQKHTGCFCRYERWTRLGRPIMISVVVIQQPLLANFVGPTAAFNDDGLGSILARQPKVHVGSFQCHDVMFLRCHWTFLIWRNSPRIWSRAPDPFRSQRVGSGDDTRFPA